MLTNLQTGSTSVSWIIYAFNYPPPFSQPPLPVWTKTLTQFEPFGALACDKTTGTLFFLTSNQQVRDRQEQGAKREKQTQRDYTLRHTDPTCPL